tara:strand:+ start:521 stop:649 length:129 start_codon:yes stop_codon:yes gene_type:complete
MSTRPRISFDEKGKCNTCQKMEKRNFRLGLKTKRAKVIVGAT